MNVSISYLPYYKNIHSPGHVHGHYIHHNTSSIYNEWNLTQIGTAKCQRLNIVIFFIAREATGSNIVQCSLYECLYGPGGSYHIALVDKWKVQSCPVIPVCTPGSFEAEADSNATFVADVCVTRVPLWAPVPPSRPPIPPALHPIPPSHSLHIYSFLHGNISVTPTIMGSLVFFYIFLV